MDPKWTLSLLAAILHTVASAPESVFALEGNSVTLIMRHDNISNGTHIYDVTWVFNQSCDVVKYYPHYNKRRQLRIPDPYKGRIHFDRTTFSLELINPQKKDSGLYKGEINADGRKAVSEYRLNVLEQVTAPVLIVESVSSSGDLCNVTVTCRAGDLSLTSTCDISTCTQEEQAAPSSLTIFIKDGVIICNHSNPLSWHHATVELETLCQKQEIPLGDEQTPIWIYITVASGLVLLVLIGGVLFFRMHSKNQVLTVT
ncbi:SLAM family member 9-like [Clupea harengus]|uniref:SLAM family member 9-like n=1 Tax=Clupea harengus TaxID=7950 RepID=A0A8M1K760_CLUHA|nr:SLAM family member 9-like [Clupea harengus]